MSIYVIRHAEKETGDFYTSDVPLNNQPISEKGRQQAQQLAEHFRNVEITSIFVSQYLRTGQTIAETARVKGVTPVVDARLNEINIGILEKAPDEQVEKEFPDFWKDFLTRDRDFTFPGGESGEEAGARIFELFNSLDPLRNSILVAHDGIIRTLICKVLGLPTYRRHLFRVDYCSITVFEWSARFTSWTIPLMNAG